MSITNLFRAGTILDDKVRRGSMLLSSGEEYELCFTVSEQNRGSLQSALSYKPLQLTIDPNEMNV